MGDNATFNNPGNTNAAAYADKGKGKAQDPAHEMSVDEDSESESEPEVVSPRNSISPQRKSSANLRVP